MHELGFEMVEIFELYCNLGMVKANVFC